MGQGTSTTLNEIEAARQRLQRDIDVLEERIRPGSDLREQAIRMGGMAAAAGVGLLVVAGATRRRLRRRAAHRHARLQADALVDALEGRRSSPLGPERDDVAAPAEATSTVALLAALATLVASIVQFVARRPD